MQTKKTRDIQLVLMSNTSWREFPDNTNSSFAVRLAEPLRIDPKTHEVGLVDAHCSKTWTMEGGQRLLVSKLEVSGPAAAISKRRHDAVVNLPKNRYENVEQIVGALNSELAATKLKGVPASKNVSVEYDKAVDAVRRKLFSTDEDADMKAAAGFDIEPGMAKLLRVPTGPTAKTFAEPDIEITGAPRARVSDPQTPLYVYCDLVEEYRVGDGLSSLLRILPSRDGAGSEVYEEPRNIQWLECDIVRVDIRHDDGTLIPFNGGKVILTVRLKPF